MAEQVIRTPDGQIRMMTPSGEMRDVPEAEYHAAMGSGYRPVSQNEYVEYQLNKKAQGRGLEAFGISALNAATLGLASPAIKALAGGEDIARIMDQNSGASLAGNVVGTLGSALVGGPVAGVGRAAAGVGARAGAKVAATAAGKGAIKEAVASGAGKVAELAARGAVEGAVIGAGDAAGEAVLRGNGMEAILDKALQGAKYGAITGAIADPLVGTPLAALKTVGRKAVKASGLARAGQVARAKKAMEIAERDIVAARQADPEGFARFQELMDTKLPLEDELKRLRANPKPSKNSLKKIEGLKEQVDDLNREIKQRGYRRFAVSGSEFKGLRNDYNQAIAQMGFDLASKGTGIEKAMQVASGVAGAVGGMGAGGAIGGMVGGHLGRTSMGFMARLIGDEGLTALAKKLRPGGTRRGLDFAHELSDLQQLKQARFKHAGKYASKRMNPDYKQQKWTVGSGQEVSPDHWVGDKQLKGEAVADLAGSLYNKLSGTAASANRVLGVGQRLMRYAPKSAAIYAMGTSELEDTANALRNVDNSAFETLRNSQQLSGVSPEQMDAALAGPAAGIEHIKSQLPPPGKKMSRQEQVKFKDLLAIQVDPMHAIDLINKDKITIEQLMQLEKVSPSLRQWLRQYAQEAIDEYEMTNKQPGRKAQQTLTKLLSGQGDTKHALQLQETYGPKDKAEAIKLRNIEVDTKTKIQSVAQRLEEKG